MIEDKALSKPLADRYAGWNAAEPLGHAQGRPARSTRSPNRVAKGRHRAAAGCQAGRSGWRNVVNRYV